MTSATQQVTADTAEAAFKRIEHMLKRDTWADEEGIAALLGLRYPDDLKPVEVAPVGSAASGRFEIDLHLWHKDLKEALERQPRHVQEGRLIYKDWLARWRSRKDWQERPTKEDFFDWADRKGMPSPWIAWAREHRFIEQASLSTRSLIKVISGLLILARIDPSADDAHTQLEKRLSGKLVMPSSETLRKCLVECAKEVGAAVPERRSPGRPKGSGKGKKKKS